MKLRKFILNWILFNLTAARKLYACCAAAAAAVADWLLPLMLLLLLLLLLLDVGRWRRIKNW